MNFIKARYNGQARGYTFKTKDEVVPGDKIKKVGAIGKTPELTVIDEPVDEKWIETYGEDKIQEVVKVEGEVK